MDHFIVLGEAHLQRILRAYAHYYNEVRTHRSLDKDAPVSRAVQRAGILDSRPIPADFITITSEFRYSVHTSPSKRAARVRDRHVVEVSECARYMVIVVDL